MKKIVSLLLLLIISLPSYAVIGFGLHWGLDLTTEMENNSSEYVNIGIDTTALPNIPDMNYSDYGFMYVSRMNFDRSPVNFGAKVLIDILPVDIEGSMNFGLWKYDGHVRYFNPQKSLLNQKISYDTLEITPKEVLGNGLNETPYTKLQFDLTLKRTFFKKKKSMILKPSLGAGATVQFASPVLTNTLVEDALDIDGREYSAEDFQKLITADGATKAILDEITDGAKKPKAGMHLVVGLYIKPPVIPLSIYADGKAIIMFEEIEKNIGMNNTGFMLNTGIMLKF